MSLSLPEFISNKDVSLLEEYSGDNFSENLNDNIKSFCKDCNPGDCNKRSESVCDKNLETLKLLLLPEEILLHIFSFLSPSEICRYVAPVCKQLWSLSKDPSLWRHLSFPFENKLSNDEIKVLITKSRYLITLTLESCSESGEILEKLFLHTSHKLRFLKVTFCGGLKDETISCLVKSCPQLELLSLEGTDIPSISCCEAIAGFRLLKHLNLSHCVSLDNKSFIQIAEECRQLKYLNIDGISCINDFGIHQLVKFCGLSLTNLYLDGEHLTDSSYRYISKCYNLEQLGISFCEGMTDYGLSSLISLKNLNWLKLRKGVQLLPKSLEQLFTKGNFIKLTYLNLGECVFLDDTVIQAIADGCPILKTLVIHWCWEVTDSGMFSIVKKCPEIVVLDLVGLVCLTGEFLKTIPDFLLKLKIIDLEQCGSIDDNALSSLARRAPTLKIFNYWGDPVEARKHVPSQGGCIRR